jgi:hypothetical protein
MPWTIPNLLLHDKPLPLSEQRAFGYTKIFVYCSSPGCHHNAVLDASHLPDEITFNDLQLRMVRTVCDHRGADVRTAWHLRSVAKNLISLQLALTQINARLDPRRSFLLLPWDAPLTPPWE